MEYASLIYSNYLRFFMTNAEDITLTIVTSANISRLFLTQNKHNAVSKRIKKSHNKPTFTLIKKWQRLQDPVLMIKPKRLKNHKKTLFLCQFLYLKKLQMLTMPCPLTDVQLSLVYT